MFATLVCFPLLCACPLRFSVSLLKKIVSTKKISVIFTSCGHTKIFFLKNMHTESLKQSLGSGKPQLTLSRVAHFIKGAVMCLVGSVQKYKKKKKKYCNLIREKNMIIFIDRGTTRNSYPKLCLSDNSVSFSTLTSTARLVM